MSYLRFLMSQPLDVRDRNTVKPVRVVAIAANKQLILKKKGTAENGD